MQSTSHLILNFLLLLSQELYLVLIRQAHTALFENERLSEGIPVERLSLQHGQVVIECFLAIGIALIKLISEVLPLPWQHGFRRQAFLDS